MCLPIGIQLASRELDRATVMAHRRFGPARRQLGRGQLRERDARPGDVADPDQPLVRFLSSAFAAIRGSCRSVWTSAIVQEAIASPSFQPNRRDGRHEVFRGDEGLPVIALASQEIRQVRLRLERDAGIVEPLAHGDDLAEETSRFRTTLGNTEEKRWPWRTGPWRSDRSRRAP
jgi:hypothetical protein